MRINRLVLENFGSHEATDLDLTKGNLFMFAGPSGAGKTTIFDAVRWCLTGKARGYLAKESRHLVRDGSKSCKVLATIQRPNSEKQGEVARTPSGCSATVDEIQTMVGVKKLATLEAALDCGRLVRMDREERLRLFQTLLCAGVSKADLDTAGIKDPDIRTAVLERSVSSGQAVATAKRREYQRAADNLNPPQPTATISLNGRDIVLSEQDPTALQTALAALRADRDALIKALAGSEPPEVAELLRKQAALMTRGFQMREELRSYTARVDTMVPEIERLKEQITSVKTSGECPYCGSKPSADSPLLSNLQTTIAPMEEDVASIRTKIAPLNAEMTQMRHEWAAIDGQITNLRNSAGAGIKEKIAAVDKEIASGETILNAKIRFDEGVKGQADIASRKAALIAKSEEYRVMEETLSPDGLVARKMLEPMREFRAVVDRLAGHAFPDGRRVEISDDFEISLDGRPMHAISEGEEFRVAAVIGSGMSSLSGVRILFLDGVNKLEPAARDGLLVGMLHLVNEAGLEQVFVANVFDRTGWCPACETVVIEANGRKCPKCAEGLTMKPVTGKMADIVRTFDVLDGKVTEAKEVPDA